MKQGDGQPQPDPGQHLDGAVRHHHPVDGCAGIPGRTHGRAQLGRESHLVLVFTAVMLLIADLDRLQRGIIQVSQQAMIDVVNKIGAPAP